MGRMKWALALNFIFACIELAGGLWTNSLAVLSDALHDFGDALAIALALFLESVSHKKSDDTFSYGYRRFSTLGAVVTGLVLVVGSIVILMESIPRLLHPQRGRLRGHHPPPLQVQGLQAHQHPTQPQHLRLPAVSECIK